MSFRWFTFVSYAVAKFPKPLNSFSHELKERVHHYFEANNIASTGNAQLYTKAILLPLIYIALYISIVFFTPPVWLALTECAVMGLAVAAIGFNVMHDGVTAVSAITRR